MKILNPKQYKIYSFLNRRISTTIAIATIFILSVLLGGFSFWQYSKIPREQSKEIEIKQPQKRGEIVEKGKDKGLVAFYHFNEGKGYEIKDFSGNQNHGSFYTTAADQQHRFYYPKWRRGLEGGYALEFNYNSFVEIPDSPSLNFNKSKGTIEMWVQPHWFCDLPFTDYFEKYGKECPPNTYQRLIIDKNWQIELGIDPQRNLYFYPSNTVSKNYNLIRSPLENFKWNHIAVSWDFLKKKVSFYINGEKRGNDIENVTAYWDKIAKTSDWQIGGTSLDISSKFEGLIDEVKIYDRELSGEEIKNHYQLIKREKEITDESFEIIRVLPLLVEERGGGYSAGDIRLEEVKEKQSGRMHYFRVFYKDKELERGLLWDENCGRYPGILTFTYRDNKYIFFEKCLYGSGGAWDTHCLYLIDQELNNLQPVLPGIESPHCFCFDESRGFTVIGYKNFIFIISGANHAAGVADLYQSYRIDVIRGDSFMGAEVKSWEISE